MKKVTEMPMFFFLHVPKTGGMSMLAFFRQSMPNHLIFHYKGKNQVKIWNEPNLYNKYLLATGHIKFRKKLLNIRDREIVFLSLYRNSVERVVSHYDYVRRRPDHKLHPRLINLSLLEAWRTDDVWRDLNTNTHLKFMFGSDRIGKCLLLLKSQKYVIGRTNKIEQFADFIADVMELPWRISNVPKRNTSESETSLFPPARNQPDFHEACELIRKANTDEIKFYDDILQDDIFENLSN